jgi:hypothetical protein
MGFPIKVLGRRRIPGEMNKTELAYSEFLEGLRMAGKVSWWSFEAVTFKLAADTRYTPDFLVMLPGGEMECHEVKGFWRDDARVKIKVAAAMFPFQFLAVSKSKAGWETERF